MIEYYVSTELLQYYVLGTLVWMCGRTGSNHIPLSVLAVVTQVMCTCNHV